MNKYIYLTIKKSFSGIFEELKNLRPSKWVTFIQSAAAIVTIITLGFLIYNLRQVNRQIRLQIDGQKDIENSINLMNRQIELQSGANKLLENLVLNMADNKALELTKYEEEKKKYEDQNKPDLIIDKLDPKADSNQVALYVTIKNVGKATASQIKMKYECKDCQTKEVAYIDSISIQEINIIKPIVINFKLKSGCYGIKFIISWRWSHNTKEYKNTFYKYIKYDSKSNSYTQSSITDEALHYFWPN